MSDTIKSTVEHLAEIRETADRWRTEGDERYSAELLAAHGLREGV